MYVYIVSYFFYNKVPERAFDRSGPLDVSFALSNLFADLCISSFCFFHRVGVDRGALGRWSDHESAW